MTLLTDYLVPDWAAPTTVRAMMSTRQGGVSQGPFESMNLRWPADADRNADTPDAVAENRLRLSSALDARPVWLNQVHGAEVVRLSVDLLAGGTAAPRADASVSTVPGLACAVMVADCLPLLMCSPDGRAVAAAHAGWRGLALGVVERTVDALCEAAGCVPVDLQVWLGACIGPRHFEVGADVLEAFGAMPQPRDQTYFAFCPRPDGQMRWLADLPGLTLDRLRRVGVLHTSGGGWCTVADPSRFFSFRRDGRVGRGVTGRMVAAIAIVG